jgi:hypothetical protein
MASLCAADIGLRMTDVATVVKNRSVSSVALLHLGFGLCVGMNNPIGNKAILLSQT